MPTDFTQPGIYNALDYDLSKADTTGLGNRVALQDAINTAVSDGGGIVLIPSTDKLELTGFRG